MLRNFNFRGVWQYEPVDIGKFQSVARQNNLEDEG
jgi:hypothetical protein